MKTRLTLVIIFLGIIVLTGCIRSRLIIESEPAGADVTINNEYWGRTPVEMPFIWYWYYDIELEKEGYERLESRERLHAPLWFWMPFDLIMEAMPFPIYDTKNGFYVLSRQEEL